ncbi:MAG: hypothetical protein B7Y88_11580 [Sphingomonadales bacterium 32-64-17]|nr:MAG: hypothetical protein B7Y88_11580 [Sphingomonadales bacterium 32-64-17]
MSPVAFSSPLRNVPGTSVAPAIGALVGVLLAALGILGLLYWSTASADALSRERQHRLIGNVLRQSAAQIAHDQESVTVWDEAIHQVRRSQFDLEWFDSNLGIWLHDYYGHDGAYVLNSSDEPLYSMRGGERGKPEDFNLLGKEVLELVRELRDNTRNSASVELAADQLSPTATDLLVVDGHPSIVSVTLACTRRERG